MVYAPHARSCISIPFNEIPHLFVVMNDPCPDGHCLLVMVSSVKPNRKHDPSCILDDGDHPYIDHESYAVYRLADTMLVSHISKMVDLKYYEPRVDMDAAIFEKISAGLFASDETRNRVIKYANAVGV